MFASLADHLWQSFLTLGLLQVCVFSARRHAASVRLALCRAGALKFAVPYQATYALGGWLGFPVYHSADPVPPALSVAVTTLAPWAAPAAAHGLGGFALAASLAALLVCGVACARPLHERLRLERFRTAREALRRARDPDDVPPGLGFGRGLLFSALFGMLLAAPVMAGAVRDREHRQALLAANARSLRDAEIVMKPAAAGMGGRVRVSADESGIFIRNATIRDLAGLAYGVNRFFVRGDHFYEAGERDWLIDARYDVRITGPVREPREFDTYALRAPMTKFLAEHHGLEIYVNNACQPPCGRYGVPMPVDDQ